MYALYCALILPHLAYCVEVWGNNDKTNLMSFNLSEKASHVTPKNNFLDHTSVLFKNLYILPSFHLIKFRNAISIHKT